MSFPVRQGRITLGPNGEIIGSSIEHISPGDPVIFESRDGMPLYRRRFDPGRL